MTTYRISCLLIPIKPLIAYKLQAHSYQNVQAFAPGSPERDSLRAELARVEATCKDIPIVIGGEEIRNDNVKYQVSPYNHSQKIAKYYWADKDLLHKAANAAVAAQVSLPMLKLDPISTI